MNQNENKHYSALDEMNEYLEHHGIKGMKWGVRRTPEQLGHKVSSSVKKAGSAAGKAISEHHAKSKAKAAVKKAAKKQAKAEKKAHDKQVKKDRDFTSAKNLTNQELYDRINRLRNEATYKQLLNDANGKTVNKGKRLYMDAFGKGSAKAVEKGAQALGGKLLNSLLADENNLNPTGFYKEDKNRFASVDNSATRNKPDFEKQQEHKPKSGATYTKSSKSSFKDAVNTGKAAYEAYKEYTANNSKQWENHNYTNPIDVDFTVEDINDTINLPAPTKVLPVPKKKKRF